MSVFYDIKETKTKITLRESKGYWKHDNFQNFEISELRNNSNNNKYWSNS